MSILIQTSFGDLTVDLWTERCPNATLNFIKLCKVMHYNNSLFIEVQKNHVARVLPEKPTTIWELTSKDKQKRNFNDQMDHQLKFREMGYLATANKGPNLNNSQFFITLTKADLSSLNGKHTVFGKIEEGFDVLRKINDSYCDKHHRPQMNIRIINTFILSDPFEDLDGMQIPSQLPQLKKDSRLEAVQHLQMLQKYEKQDNINELINKQKAKKQAVTLQMLGDLPDANIKPPENILFVCKLNPVTQQRDLQIIFSRFGPIKSVQIVRDWKTGQSLQYSFIEFQTPGACEQAYLKMNNVLIDDRRIQVDFSQSVTKLMPRNRKPGQPQKKLVKQHQTTQKKQKIVRVGRKSQDDSKYNLITSKPNYQSKARQYEDIQPKRHRDSKHQDQKKVISQEKQQGKKQKLRQKQKQRKSKREESRSISESNHKRGVSKKKGRSLSKQSSQRSRDERKRKAGKRDKSSRKDKKDKKQKKQKKQKRQKKQKKRKNKHSSSSQSD